MLKTVLFVNYTNYVCGLRWSMYHGDANERQRSELHMVRKEGGREKWQ